MTYAYDGRQHMKHVINVAKNFQRNGLAVAIDEKSRVNDTESDKQECARLRYNKVSTYFL